MTYQNFWSIVAVLVFIFVIAAIFLTFWCSGILRL